MNRFFRALCLTLTLGILVVSLCSKAFGQSTANAQISGAVTDPSGALIPNAKVTATQTDTNTARTTVSGVDGSYLLPVLPIGPYKLRVEAAGFETYVQTGITLQVGESPKIPIVLKLGRASEEVVVESNAAMVQTDTTSIAQVIDQQRMVDMPLNGRVPTQLIMLSGAANDAGPANGLSDLQTSKNYFSSDNISVAGGQANGTNYLLDGVENMDIFSNVNLPLPFPDAIQEFSVDTSSLSARYGIHPGAVVNVAMKSGSNQFHGDLFEFVRNGATNAANYFGGVDPLKRNQFGGTVGGPILRDKLFGFFGYQQTTIRTAPNTTKEYVPTQAALGGDFSALESASCQSSGSAQPIIDPQTGNPFAGDQVATARFNQQAMNLLKYVPTSTDPCGVFRFAIPQPQSERQIVARADENLSAKNLLFAHYFSADYSSPGPYSPSNILLTGARGVIDHDKSALLGDTYTINEHLVNAAHLGYTRLAINRGASPNGINLDKIGVQLPYQPFSNTMYVAVQGYFQAGCGTCGDANFTQNNLQASDDIDYTFGRHHLSVGGEWLNYRFNYENGYLANGQFNFNGQNTNDGLLDFMLGLPNQFQQANIVTFDGRQNYFAVYAHDVVRLTKHLTAQAGVRWEPNIWGKEAGNRMQHFDEASYVTGATSSVFPNAPAGEFFAGDKGIPGSFSQNHYWKFEPRVGLAWDPTGTGRQILRAGYGLFYDTLSLGYWEDQAAGAPWGDNITVDSPAGGFTNPYAGYPGGNPYPTPQPPPSNTVFPTQATYYNYPLNMRPMYTNNWNLSYEIQPLKDWVLSVGYLGSVTHHILTAVDENPGTYVSALCPDPNTCWNNQQQRRVLSQINQTTGNYYSDIYEANDAGSGNYHGLLLKGEHRFAEHYTILGNFTYSHCISDADFQGDLNQSQTQNPNSISGERGNCGFDIRKGFNLSVVGEAPRVKSNRVLDTLVGSWKLAPLLVWHTGTWFTPWTGQDNSMTGIYLDRPNITGKPYIRSTSPSTNWQWIDPNAYQSNPYGTFGNASTDSLLAPGYIDLDAALSKQFNMGEQRHLELRFETFNLANHPNFAPPQDMYLTDSSFGQLSNDIAPRILQFAAKFQF